MSRMVVALVVVVVVVVGALILLAGRAHDQPTSRVEKVVPIANLQG